MKRLFCRAIAVVGLAIGGVTASQETAEACHYYRYAPRTYVRHYYPVRSYRPVYYCSYAVEYYDYGACRWSRCHRSSDYHAARDAAYELADQGHRVRILRGRYRWQ